MLISFNAIPNISFNNFLFKMLQKLIIGNGEPSTFGYQRQILLAVEGVYVLLESVLESFITIALEFLRRLAFVQVNVVLLEERRVLAVEPVITVQLVSNVGILSIQKWKELTMISRKSLIVSGEFEVEDRGLSI